MRREEKEEIEFVLSIHKLKYNVGFSILKIQMRIGKGNGIGFKKWSIIYSSKNLTALITEGCVDKSISHN